MHKVDRELLLRTLESVSPGLAVKEILEQTTSFAFVDGDILTFNDEIACRIASPVEGLTGSVQSKPLLAILQKLDDPEVSVEMGDGELIVHGKKRKAGIRMDAEVLLPVQHVEKPKKWTKLQEEFLDAVSMVEKCAQGKDESMIHTVCVHVHPKWVEACDKYQLCRWRVQTGVNDPVLVRRDSIKHVPQLGMVEISETDAWLHFRNPAGLIFSCRRFVEEFNNLTPFIKVQGEKAILPKGLAEAAGKARIFSVDNAEGDRVEISLKKDFLSIRGEGAKGWYEEQKKCKYDGKEMTFFVSPEILADLVTQHNECELTDKQILIRGGKWVYSAWLSRQTNIVEEEEPVKKKAKRAGKDEEE